MIGKGTGRGREGKWGGDWHRLWWTACTNRGIAAGDGGSSQSARRRYMGVGWEEEIGSHGEEKDSVEGARRGVDGRELVFNGRMRW